MQQGYIQYLIWQDTIPGQISIKCTSNDAYTFNRTVLKDRTRNGINLNVVNKIFKSQKTGIVTMKLYVIYQFSRQIINIYQNKISKWVSIRFELVIIQVLLRLSCGFRLFVKNGVLYQSNSEPQRFLPTSQQNLRLMQQV